MPFVRRTFPEITETLLNHITKGIINERHDYNPHQVKYRLKEPKVEDIVMVQGRSGGNPCVFRKGIDYQQSGNMVEWLADGEKPDISTSFFVNYAIDAPRAITDINPGSVTRTFVEALALEMDYLYTQMEKVYFLAFIDTAGGKALDLVVSLLGILRKPAGYAEGMVTFGRKNEPGEKPVKEQFTVNEASQYRLKTKPKKITFLEGICGSTSTRFKEGIDFRLTGTTIEWISGGKAPDTKSTFDIEYTAYDQIVIPLDTRVSNLTRIPENLKIFRTTREGTLTKNEEGRWEVAVPVMALNSGRSYNVFAGTLTGMPKPSPGIEYVINKENMQGGTDPERDEELRARAKRALESAGKATKVALKNALENTKVVEGEVKVFDSPGEIPGVVQVIVSGYERHKDEIDRVIDETRAAGIYVERKEPEKKYIDVALTIKVVEGIDGEKIKREVDHEIKGYLSSLQINENVILNRLIKLALSVQGVRDVKDISIVKVKENIKLKENIEVEMDEKVVLRSLDIFWEV
jgi:uncharacterized phage protein gp47/JayE